MSLQYNSGTAAAPPTAPSHVGRVVSGLLLAVIVAASATALGFYLHHEQGVLLEDARAASSQLDSSGSLRPLAIVRGSLEALAVVTEIVDSEVTVEVKDESIRGDSKVRLRVPVRYFYATRLDPDTRTKIDFNPLNNTCRVLISRPERIATEVMTDKPLEETLDVSGLRFKGMSGTTQLVVAMKQTREKALVQQLPPQDLKRITDSAARRVQQLLQKVVGPRVTVEVAVGP